MKYKIICVVLVIVALSSSFFLQSIEPEKNRYHQHQEVLPKEACTDHGEEVFCTHLPLLNITTDGEMPSPYVLDEEGNILSDALGNRIMNNAMAAVTIQYFDSESRNNHLNDTPVIEERGLIRIRGASSRSFDKKGYLLKFTEENLVDGKAVAISGMTADSDWVLHGPFLDKTLIRNYLCYNLAGEIMEYAPNVRFCEAYLNGEYIGVYLIVEKIEQNENGRIMVEKTDPKFAETSFIFKLDRWIEDESVKMNTFSNYAYIRRPGNANAGYFQIDYPGKTLTEQQRKYIETYISDFEKTLYSYAYADEKNGYRKYIDVGSFVDYFLINEFTLNYDAGSLSTYVYKDIGGKMKMCVWDFNSAFDYYENSVITPEAYYMQNGLWYDYLFKDKEFVDEVEKRYKELRDRYFNTEYLYQYIDDTVEYLGPAIDRNYEKWGYSFQSEYNGKNYDYLTPEERNVRTYEEAIEQLKGCISQRIEHMDANLERLLILCHESLNKKNIYNKESN